MSDFAASWKLSRGRFTATILELNHHQLNRRPVIGALSCAEMALHVAGVEAYFIGQGLNLTFTDEQKRIIRCATEGVVNEGTFPFSAEELTPEFVKASLDWASSLVQPVIESPTEAFLNAQITTALGPVASGRDCLARLAFHPAYHQGQAYLYSLIP